MTSASISSGQAPSSEVDSDLDIINTSEIEEVLQEQSEFLNSILFD